MKAAASLPRPPAARSPFSLDSPRREPPVGGLPSLAQREIGAETLILVVSLFFTLACNRPLWAALLEDRVASAPSTWAYAAALACVLTALQFVLMALLATRWTLKPVLALFITVAAASSFYMGKFGVYLDPSMLRNVLRTDLAEARELLTADFVLHLATHAGLPLLLLYFVRVRRRRLGRAVLVRVLAVLAALLVAGGALGTVFKDFAAQMRTHKEIRYLATPVNALYSTARVLGADAKAATREKVAIGVDAVPGASWAGHDKPVLFVIVVGETVRAQNWGLNRQGGRPGERDTTPELARRDDLINFSEVSSCGTNTEVSVPCMFSLQGRRNYDEDAIRGSESLLNVLARAGLRVSWDDNQSGCKGVCDGVESLRPDAAAYPDLCDGERCLDEALLRDTERLMKEMGGQDRQSRVLVLHTLGNHGPAYFKRYPPAFRRFTPTCDTEDLGRCTQEQIANSYDNAVLYTDHVLSRLIDTLAAQENRFDSALVYVSDHGESLGEKGLFLHGMPYAIAPREQTRVPMVMWLSPDYAQRFGVDTACLRDRAAQPASHDNLFHSVLGLLDVRTSVRDEAMDLSAACRSVR